MTSELDPKPFKRFLVLKMRKMYKNSIQEDKAVVEHWLSMGKALASNIGSRRSLHIVGAHKRQLILSLPGGLGCS